MEIELDTQVTVALAVVSLPAHSTFAKASAKSKGSLLSRREREGERRLQVVGMDRFSGVVKYSPYHSPSSNKEKVTTCERANHLGVTK